MWTSIISYANIITHREKDCLDPNFEKYRIYTIERVYVYSNLYITDA
jgi:hypothetical protein